MELGEKPKKESTPYWIGLHIPLSMGYVNVCLGINQEDGHEVSFYGDGDYDAYLEQEGLTSPWCYGDPNMGELELKVVEGEDGKVFDDEHKLIK